MPTTYKQNQEVFALVRRKQKEMYEEFRELCLTLDESDGEADVRQYFAYVWFNTRPAGA